MKKYIFPLILSTVMLFTACSEDKLDIPKKGVISLDSFYITDDDAVSALTNAYQNFIVNIGGNAGIYVPYNIIFNYPADNVLAAGNHYGDNDFLAKIDEFRYDTQNEVITNIYKRLYFTIYHANLVIDNFEYGKSTVKDRCISEARVMRAWCHMMAALIWGNPPLIDHILVSSEKPTNYTGTKEDFLRWCATECAESVQYLDERASTTDKDGAVKITKGFAWTVQGKALLYAGDYADAKAPLKKVIDSGKYELVPGTEWADMFHLSGDGNSEKIFELNLIENASIGTWGGKIQRSTWMEQNLWGWRSDKMYARPIYQADGGWGGLAIEESFANEFYANDGDSYRRKATMLSFYEFLTELDYPSDYNSETQEPLNLTVAQKLDDPNRGIKHEGGLYGQCGFLQIKHIVRDEDRTTNSIRFNNFIISRYADVLLMYAEACANTTDEGGLGLKCLKDIQNRAGSDYVSSELTLPDVKKERNYELWCEGARWIDMIRWGELDKVATAGRKIPSLKDKFKAEYDENTGKYIRTLVPHEAEVTYSYPNGADYAAFDAAKHKLFPFPYAITSINPDLEQHGEWK